MMNISKKTISLFILLTVFLFNTYAQGFSSFNAEGAITPALINDRGDKGASIVEQIVNNQADLRSIQFKYKLYSSCSLNKELGKDFATPQQVTVSKNGISKEWIVNVKQLKPANLPFTVSFSESDPSIYTANTKGWATYGTDESKTTVVRFGNAGAAFLVAFSEGAKEVAYTLNLIAAPNDTFNGKFQVEESPDGIKWKRIVEYNSQNPFEKHSTFVNALSSDSRFVKWTYTSRQKMNVNLNDINIR